MNYKSMMSYAAALYIALAPQVSNAVQSRERSAINSATYLVQRGDTLGKISQRAGIEIDEIRKCNPSSKVLKYDTMVRLYNSYVVQSGDTLSGVAWKKGMTLAELVGYNPHVRDLDTIYAGQKLKMMCRGKRVDKEERRVEEPEYVERVVKRKGKRKEGKTVRFPSGLELAIVSDPALVDEGKYFNGASRIPLVRISRNDLFKRISKHFIVAEFVRVEEKEERCIDAKAKPYVHHVGGNYYFTHARIDPVLVKRLEQVRAKYGKPLEIDEGVSTAKV